MLDGMVDDGSSRERIVRAALGILGDEGVKRLTVRAVTERAGCSTTGIYTYFGGKQGLLDALYSDGYEMLDHHTPEPVTDRPDEDIVEGLVKYRAFALEHPALYLLMFASRAQGYLPSEEAARRGEQSLRLFGNAVARAVEAGVLDADPSEAALHLWGAAHGFVMLELTGPGLGELSGETVLRRALRTILDGYRA